MDMNNTVSHLGEDVSSAVKQMAGLGRTAGEKIHEARLGTADALAGAASSVRTTGRQGSDTIDNLAERAASKLDSTAAYVRKHDVREMFGKLRQVVRRHPTSFLFGAAAIGFFVGSGTRRK
jgi:hypothetical protein